MGRKREKNGKKTGEKWEEKTKKVMMCTKGLGKMNGEEKRREMK